MSQIFFLFHLIYSSFHLSHQVEIDTKGFIKINNFDRFKSSQAVSVGHVSQDHRGEISDGENLGEAFILVAKTTTMRKGIKATLQAGSRHMVVQGDKKILVQLVRKEIHARGKFRCLSVTLYLFFSFQVTKVYSSYLEGS